MSRKFIITIFLLIASISAFSTDYFVNKYSGDDNYNGLFSSFTGGINGPKKSIQQAINTCSANDKIFISAGLYLEYLTINKQIHLYGSGSASDTTSNTVIQSPSNGNGTGLSIVFQGIPPIVFSNIENIRIQQFQYGAVIASKVNYSNIVVTNNSFYGFWNGPNTSIRDIDFYKCEIIENTKAGIYIGHSCDVIAWMIDSCNISDNGLAGIYIFCDNPSTSNVIDFLLRNSTFKRNKQKGIYAEKLHNCLFENLLFDSCGIDTNYNWNAGFDINLKYGNYTNLTITTCEFINCGIGGSNQAGCGMIVKARDDGAVYGIDPATLSNSKIVGNKFHYCKNGLIFGEPQKNNFGPSSSLIQENKLAYNQLVNLVSNIQSDIHAHNNCWLTTNGPSFNDTSINNTGELLTYTWVKNITDQNPLIGFQSDSLVWFNKVFGSLQKAFDVTPSAWTLFIPDSSYHGNYQVSNLMNIFPEQFVYISSLHFNKLAYIDLINTDLYISDSIFIHKEAYFNTGNQAIELSDTGRIIEESGYVLQGKIRTSRYIDGNPDVEDFGGIGLTLTAKLSQAFPQNNVILCRTTGNTNMYSKKQLLRTYDVFAHKSCNWDAELKFKYDESEIYQLTTDSNLILMKSYNSGISWQLNGGDVDTLQQSVALNHVSNVNGLWSIIDSSGTIAPASMMLDSKITHCSCPEGSDGRIEITVEGGYKPYSYLWSDGNQTASIDSLIAGSYWIIVSDTHGCSIIDTIIIKQADTIEANFWVKDVSCFGGSNGKLTLIPQGGTLPYRLNWLFGDTSYILENLSAKLYFVTITDSNNCTFNDSITVNQPAVIQILSDVTDVSCFGKSDGRIFTSVIGGTPPYQHFWGHGSSADSLHNLKKGFYYLSILDSNSCIQTDTIELKQPDVLLLSLITEDVKCFGDSSGNIQASITGGTPPFVYVWYDMDSTANRINIKAGAYKLQIFDSNQCTTTDSVIINQPDLLQLSFTTINDTNNKCIGEAEAFVSGGILPYSFQWDDANLQQSVKAIGLCSGIYLLHILDSNSCAIDSSIEIINIINDNISESSSHIDIYPNPIHDKLYINSQDRIEDIFIINLNAQIVLKIDFNANQGEIILSELESGSYIIKAVGDKNVYTRLIIKE